MFLHVSVLTKLSSGSLQSVLRQVTILVSVSFNNEVKLTDTNIVT